MEKIQVAKLWLFATALVSVVGLSMAQLQCGTQGGGANCFLGLCCSASGYCGTGDQYCGTGCQNGPCTAPSPGGALPPPSPVIPEPSVADVVSEQLFAEIFPIRNASFYTYESFVAAANSFKGFGTKGGAVVQRRELAAFFAHVTLETYGLYYVDEQNTADTYCDPTATQYPCAPGQTYHGRGPLQLSWNFNYGPAGAALKQNLLGYPSLLSTNSTLSWEASLWFWNSPSGIKPSCHDVMTGNWTPSSADVAAGRLPGFGVTIDIINGGYECGHDASSADNRVKYYKEISAIFNVDPGHHLGCSTMQPFNLPPSAHY